MKRLYLLRHCESPSSFDYDDIDRPLSHKGENDALALGRFLAQEGLFPDYILCSSARRTCQTLDGVLESFKTVPTIVYYDAIYRGSPADYLSLLEDVDAARQAVLLVGHNPVIHTLAARLAKDSMPVLYQKLVQGYAPGMLTVMDCAFDDWADLKPGVGTLSHVVAPSDYHST